MLVFQNKGMVAMMVYQTNPPGIELYFYANTFFCFSNPIWVATGHVNENALLIRCNENIFCLFRTEFCI